MLSAQSYVPMSLYLDEWNIYLYIYKFTQSLSFQNVISVHFTYALTFFLYLFAICFPLYCCLCVFFPGVKARTERKSLVSAKHCRLRAPGTSCFPLFAWFKKYMKHCDKANKKVNATRESGKNQMSQLVVIPNA